MSGSRFFAGVTALATALGVGTVSTGCDLSNAGVPMPASRLNFPIAIATARDFLLVANANADARYNSGSLQVWRLSAIHSAFEETQRMRAEMGDPCGGVDQDPCEVLIEENPQRFLVDEVRIGTHADGIAVSPTLDRVYLPVRSGRGVLTWVDLAEDGSLSCGGDPNDAIPRCDDAHRGAQVSPTASDVELPTDPTTVTVIPQERLGRGAGADAILVMHRGGSGSLFLDDRSDRAQGPELFDVLAGLPTDVVSAELEPETDLVWLTSAPAASRATRDVVAVAPIVSGTGAEIAVVQRLTVVGVDDGTDMRDIAFDRESPRAWLLSRRPEAVITLDFTLDPIDAGQAPLGEVHAVASGPSRLLRVGVPFEGETVPHTYLVASCYDANSLSVIDPDLGLIATVAGLAGPFEMAYDETREWLFVINYRDNTIGVVDFSPLRAGASPLLIAILGDPDSPSPF